MNTDDLVMMVGVEEEFHIVDLVTRQLVPEAPALLEGLPGDRFGVELQRSIVETNTKPHTGLGDLREDLVDLRRQLVQAAEKHGLGIVAAGTVPMADVDTMEVSADERYEKMRDAYRMAAREQLICGAQVHVDVPDRETAVAAMRWISPRLPALLAISASSPYWLGSDSGYASWRTQVWQRWPTTGPVHPFASAIEYDEVVQGLVRSGVISDPGMVYFDVRPSAHLSTLEVRLCDACPSVDEVVLIAGLFRALTRDACANVVAGKQAPSVPPEWLRAATWRAARSGLEGDLVDVATMRPAPAAELVRALLVDLRPSLEVADDWEIVSALAESVLGRGTSAARQRRIFARTHTLASVLDHLITETRDDPDHLAWPRGPRPVQEGGLLRGYHAPADEALDAAGKARPAYQQVLPMLEQLGAEQLVERVGAREAAQVSAGVTFRVSGDEEDSLLPFDLVPRVVDAKDWATLSGGLVQRTRALDAFLWDVYGAREVVRDGIVPAWVIDHCAGLRPETGGAVPEGRVRVTVAGIDLVHDGAERWTVLEDNLRVPSGVAYGIVSRRLTHEFLPELEHPEEILPVRDTTALLRSALLAAAPPAAGDEPSLALLSDGASNSAFFEHSFLAKEMGIPLITASDLAFEDDRVFARSPQGLRRIDVLYRRYDEEALFVDGSEVGTRLLAALRAGTLGIANAPGNGVADDKVLYAYVPQLIEYYLGEKPLLPDVPTYLCGVPSDLAYVLGHLDELVIKPVDGYGGAGVVIGPHATREHLSAVRAKIEADPRSWVAQRLVNLSTHPTFTGDRFEPRTVDLRAFVFLGEEAAVAPAALTRVAPSGSMIVNSSRGGGAKDTWILRDSPGDA